MDNYTIADQLSLLSKLMDIHGENAFKSKSYSSAAFTLEKLPQQVAELNKEKIFSIKGIGESVGNKIVEILESGELSQLKEYISKTPPGVLEMMNIKGLGPKKIHTLWKEMHLDSIEELKKACEEDRISSKKGFGPKTQQNILQSIEFQQQNSGKYLYAKVEAFAYALQAKLNDKFPGERIEISGAFRRQSEIIESLDWVTTIKGSELKNYLVNEQIELVSDRDNMLILNADNTLLLRFYISDEKKFCNKLFETSGSTEFLDAWNNVIQPVTTEEEIFSNAGINYIPPFLREKSNIIERARHQKFDNLIQTNQVKGLVHSHSNWSDGAYTIEEMAKELIDLGFEYLVISDHSKAAYYANGLSEQRIKEQHKYIGALSNFQIVKLILCQQQL